MKQTIQRNRIYTFRSPRVTVSIFVALYLLVALGADSKLPKGDLSPPVRVRWAEPWEQLPPELQQPPEPTPPKKEPPPPVEVVPYVVSNGFGTMGRASHLIGKTFGRNDSITPLEAMPYLLTDEHFLFADVRGFVTNRSQGGGNFGLGYRRLLDNWNAWGGASVWYDADQSTGKMFQQVGLSFEGLINQWELRSNVYIPVTSSQSFGNAITSSSIVGNQLLYTRTTDLGVALHGVDFEAGYSLPVLDRHVIRGFIGGYHFENSGATSVNGFRARAEAVFNNAVTAQIMYTHDKLYGDNVMVGFSLQLPFGNRHPTSGWDRSTPSPFRFVERNYNVIVDQTDSVLANQVATDPETGNPYVIDQVYSPPGGSTPILGLADGTAANPYSTIAGAQAAGANVILVQRGSVITDPVILAEGQHLFGQGNFSQSLPTTGGGQVPIPNLIAAALQPTMSATPIIEGVTGPAVTLASNSEISGFLISGADGNGLSGSGVTGVSIRDLMFTSINGDAIYLTNTSGNVFLSNIQVNSAQGNGIVVDGGSPLLSFNGEGSTISAQGNGFAIRNLTGGSISLNELHVSGTGGSGLLIDHVAANATINSLTVADSGTTMPGAAAVVMTGETGTTTTVNGVSKTVYAFNNFTGTTQLSSSTGAGLAITNTDARVNLSNLNVSSSSNLTAVAIRNASSTVSIGNLSVTTENTTGLSVKNAVDVQIGGGNLTTVNAPAIDVEASGFNARLDSVSANGSPFGIRILTSTGSFTVSGSGTDASGGTIQNTSTAGVLISSYGSTSINWVDLVNNPIGIQSSGTNSLSLTHLRITGSAGYAVDSLNDQNFLMGSSVLAGNGSAGGGSIREQATTAGTYTSTLNYNTITDANGVAFQLVNQGAAAGSSLNVSFNTNTVFGSANNSAVMAVNWSGPVTANAVANTVNLFGTNMTGILLEAPSTTSVLSATFTSNAINLKNGADSGNGIWIINGQSGQIATSSSSSSLTLNGNVIDLLGKQGTGLRFGLYNPTNVTLSSNSVTDHVGGVTGVLYDFIAGRSNLSATGNKITFLPDDSLPARSFVYSQGSPTVNLNYQQGSATNWVYNTQSSSVGFSMQPGFGTGGIVINNSYFAALQ